jgi:hypothetical protein
MYSSTFDAVLELAQGIGHDEEATAKSLWAGAEGEGNEPQVDLL